MRAILIKTSGSVIQQQWDQQVFHCWRLGEIDGLRRKATSLDFGLDIWVAADQSTQVGFNELGAQLAQRLALPEDQSRFLAPYAGDMLIIGAERTGLGRAQLRLRVDPGRGHLLPDDVRCLTLGIQTRRLRTDRACAGSQRTLPTDY